MCFVYFFLFFKEGIGAACPSILCWGEVGTGVPGSFGYDLGSVVAYTTMPCPVSE